MARKEPPSPPPPAREVRTEVVGGEGLGAEGRPGEGAPAGRPVAGVRWGPAPALGVGGRLGGLTGVGGVSWAHKPVGERRRRKKRPPPHDVHCVSLRLFPAMSHPSPSILHPPSLSKSSHGA